MSNCCVIIQDIVWVIIFFEQIKSDEKCLFARGIVGQTKNFFILGLLEKHFSLF